MCEWRREVRTIKHLQINCPSLRKDTFLKNMRQNRVRRHTAFLLRLCLIIIVPTNVFTSAGVSFDLGFIEFDKY